MSEEAKPSTTSDAATEQDKGRCAPALGSEKKSTIPTDMLRLVCQVEDTDANRAALIECVKEIRRIPFPGAQGFSVLKVEQIRPVLMAKMLPNTKLSGGGALSNKTTEAESRRPLE